MFATAMKRSKVTWLSPVQVVVNHLVWVLRAKLWTSARVVHDRNLCGLSKHQGQQMSVLEWQEGSLTLHN